jgi:hypothetical protein
VEEAIDEDEEPNIEELEAVDSPARVPKLVDPANDPKPEVETVEEALDPDNDPEMEKEDDEGIENKSP